MPSMASTFVFKLIGVFLALYISLASAVPIDDRSVKPNDTLLRPRKTPASNLCGTFRWIGRECQPTLGTGSWKDLCEDQQHDGYILEYFSTCPARHVCENLVDEDNDRTIKCVPIQEPGTSKKRKAASDPQIGSSDVKIARISVEATETATEVTIANDMKASVAAVLLSDDHEYTVAAQNIIVGKVRGTEITVCQGDSSNASKARECYPSGHFSFLKGDIIDFTWGMTNYQEASLAYTIWPSGM